MCADVSKRNYAALGCCAEFYENVGRGLRTIVRKCAEYAAVYAVDIRCTYMKCVVWTHRNVICAHSYKSLEQSPEYAAKKSSGVGGKTFKYCSRAIQNPLDAL